ncbi:MAG: hypothetical protein EAZ95_10790 [Bacteroidetes bacterium]|nr:MAG: hypothetical protein EAZ95_10790 [Bacteroidota bacterium]
MLQENLKQKDRGRYNKTDYALTLNCAKQIAMFQRFPKGKQKLVLSLPTSGKAFYEKICKKVWNITFCFITLLHSTNE